MQLVRFFITIPNGTNPDIIGLDSLCWGSIDLQITTGLGLVGVNGVNANDTATNLALRINTSLSDATLISLRTYNSLVATVVNNVVTVEFFAEPICCDYDVFLIPQEGKGGNPFINAVTQIICFDPEDLPDVDCDNYEDGTHVFRFQFVPQVGFIFGAGGTDYRYIVDPANLVVPACLQGTPFQYNASLSTLNYPNSQAFYDGWAANLQGYYWAPLYAGTVTHLGQGVIEITTNIDIFNAVTGSDICNIGLDVQCTYVDTITSPGFTIIPISQTCCFATHPPPYIDPVITPPPTIPFEVDIQAACYQFAGFDCCLLGAGGIDKIYIANWEFYKNTNPNIVTIPPIGITTDLLGKVTSINLLDNKWYELCVKGSLNIEKDNSGWQHTLELTVTVMTYINRIMLLQLVQRGLIVIVKDMNGRYWFLGEDAPMRTFNESSSTGGDSSGYAFSMQGVQGCIAREIYPSVIEGLNINDFNQCADYVGQALGTYTLWQLRNCILWDLRNNNLV